MYDVESDEGEGFEFSGSVLAGEDFGMVGQWSEPGGVLSPGEAFGLGVWLVEAEAVAGFS
jgi:hypothetical protein